MIVFTAQTRKATAVSDDVITVGSVGLPVRFVLSPEYDGLSVIACFSANDTYVDVAVLNGRSITVPPECLSVAGVALKIGIYACKPSGDVVIPTVWASAGTIRKGVEPSGVDPAEPTPSWVAQVQEYAEHAAEIAEELEADVDTWRVAETERVAAETARQLAETARGENEESRQSAELTRDTNETSRQSAEAIRVSNEEVRNSAESLRETAEETRRGEELARVSAEAARVASERVRVAAETTRESNEVARTESETLRVNNETARVAAETTRESSESARVAAEATRVSNETTRETEWAAIKSELATAYVYKGSVTNQNQLPVSGMKTGDVYNIINSSTYGGPGTNVAWTGSEWDALGETFTIGDGTLTPVMVSSGYNFMTDAEQTKLGGIETEANKTVVDSALSGTSTNPVQNAVVKDALDLKAPLASPALTGTPTAPTATAGTDTDQIATTEFVKSAVDAKFPVANADMATDAVGTVNIADKAVTTAKLADASVTDDKLGPKSVGMAALDDDILGELNAKAPLASPSLTGTPTAPTAVSGTNTTQIATTAFVKSAVDAKFPVANSDIASGAITKEKLGSALATELDNKANIDGDYPEMTVGKADNLTGRYDAVEADYLYRTAGGNADIDSGTARIESIRGNTLVWNQLLSRDNATTFNTTYVSYDATTHRYTVSYLENSTMSSKVLNIPINNYDSSHKYLIDFDADLTYYYKMRINFPGFSDYVSTLSVVQEQIGKSIHSGGSNDYFSISKSSNDTTAQSITFSLQVFDLTLMFGAGNEPSTVEEFEALFPKPYYPYDPGSLLSVNMEGIKTVGFNAYDPSTGKAKVIAGNEYQITGAYTSIAYSDGTEITPSNGYFTPSKNDELTVAGGNGTDTCVHLKWTGYRDGEYEPYTKYERDIPISTYFPDGMKSAGDVYDELTEDKAIKRVGVVDLGTLEWTYNGGYPTPFFHVTLADLNMPANNINMVSIPYMAKNGFWAFAGNDMCMAAGATYFNVSNAAYTDATTFTTAMSGVMLYYELAEPIITPINPPIPLTYEVDDFGTEEIMVDETQPAPQSAPPSMRVIYGPNVIDTVRRLPKEYISHDSMTQFRDALPFETTEQWDSVHNRYKYIIEDFMSKLNGVVNYIRYGVQALSSEKWDYVAGLTDYGEAVLDLLPIGTELTDNWRDTHGNTPVDYDFTWLVQDVNKFMFENQIEPMYGIALGAKNTLPFGTQFDAKEAFYAAPSGGVSADVYYVTWGTTWGSKIISGNSFSFTVTNAHPEGAQFEFSGDPYSNNIDTMKVNIYDICGGTVKSEECQISAGIAEGATLLCTLRASQIASGDDQNHLHRCIYANSRWDQSAIRQYLNSDLPGGTWWTPQNKWDRPPSYANYDGFMMGLPAEFKAVIQKTKVVTALSYSADGGTAAAPETVVTYDYFFLPSWEQHWLKVDNNYGAQTGLEGTPFQYWKKVSGVTTPWAAGTTHAEYIHYDLANPNTARNVFLRSASRGYGYRVTYIYSSGICNNYSALNGNYVVPVCVIRKAIA